MKKISKIAALLLTLALGVFTFAACGGNNNAGTQSSDTQSSAAQAEETTEAAAAEVDYSKVDLTINDGDFAAMESFLNDWGENKWDDKVIKITGKNARRMSNCTIMEEDTNGTGRGCSWIIIDGKFPDDYPADDAKVTVTGVLRLDPNTFARVLEVPADKVEVVQ